LTPSGEPPFEQLYDRYSAVVARVCGSILRRHDLVEDAIQEVFVRLWKRDGPGPALSDPAGWLVQVARRQALLIVRRESTRARHETRWTAERGPLVTTEDGSSRLASAPVLLEFLLASAALRPCQRHALDLYRHGWTQAEIAAYLDLSPSAVQGRIARGIEHLRQRSSGSARDPLAGAHPRPGRGGRRVPRPDPLATGDS
jgi:RNA polymerase sigma-70 factor (ECF subfamily)